MRSIRLSLVICFLGLLCVALTVASVLLHDTARRTLVAKEQAAEALAEARYEERAREARQRLDDRLLAQAKTLAGRVRPRYRWERQNNYSFHVASGVALLGSMANPGSPVNAFLNVVQAGDVTPPRPKNAPKNWRPRFVHLTSIQWQIWHHSMIDLNLIKPDVDLGDSGWPHIFTRIETNGWSGPLFPAKLKNDLPSEADFAPNARLTWVFDDYQGAAGRPIRRVRFRSLITLDSRPSGSTKENLGGGQSYLPPAALIIQCAADQSELDGILTELREQRDRELDALRSETAAALTQHRRRLLWISAATGVATALGSMLLVWLGLTPLSRMSDAVSKVSPRNFRLDLDTSRLPRELRPIAERLTTTLELLKRAFAREKQATADISHELRTPLAALMTTIDLALRKQRTPEQYREFFTDCRTSAAQMHQIVERLLTLARLDAGVDRLKAQPVDVAELAQQCASVVRPLAEARGLNLELHNLLAAVEEDGPLMTDPDKLREVLTNLLHNAIQYNRPQGRIDVTVARENGQVRLEVTDTGIGIAPEAREHIFERFYRADPSRNADDLHAGLGLAIVKEYVDLMGGRITVQSEEGQGSTFCIDLPVCGPAQAG
jgi:signal transduction histidine kinase